MWLMDQSVTCPPNLHLVLENQTANQNLDLNLGQLWTSITLQIYHRNPPTSCTVFTSRIEKNTPKNYGVEQYASFYTRLFT